MTFTKENLKLIKTGQVISYRTSLFDVDAKIDDIVECANFSYFELSVITVNWGKSDSPLLIVFFNFDYPAYLPNVYWKKNNVAMWKSAY